MNGPITAIIPARSGSKRMPGKNIRPLAGKPLVFHSLEAAMGHAEIGRVLFTSDSLEYLALAEQAYGNRVTLVHRPSETASDTAKVTAEVARLLADRGDLFASPWFALFLPTAPLRDQAVTAGVLARWRALNRPVFTCSPYDFPPQFAFQLKEGGEWDPVLGAQSPMLTGNTRSQDIPRLYRPNGAIYVTQREIFERRNILYDEALAVEIPADAAIDVDTEADFILAEAMIRKTRGAE